MCPEVNNDFFFAARKLKSLIPLMKLWHTRKTVQMKGLMKSLSLLSHHQKINR